MSLIPCGNRLIHILSLAAEGSVSLQVFNNPYCVHSMILRDKIKKVSEKYLVCVPDFSFFSVSVYQFICLDFKVLSFFYVSGDIHDTMTF